jgi:predicted porin
LEQLRPPVKALESRDEAPTAAELAQIEPAAAELKNVLSLVDQPSEPVSGNEPPKLVREARRMLQRVAALDLARQAAELRSAVEDFDPEDGPPPQDVVNRLRQEARELRAAILELQSRSAGTKPAERSVRAADEAVALSRSVEVLFGASEQQEVLEDIEGQAKGPSEQDVDRIKSAAESLQTKIERAETDSEVDKDAEELAGLRHARSILNRLLAIDVAASTARLLPQVERLESSPELPTMAELEALAPAVAELVDRLQTLKESLKIKSPEDFPPEMKQAGEVLHRADILMLRRANHDLLPAIVNFEKTENPLGPADIDRLRGIVEEMRPRIRAARNTRSTESGEAGEEPEPEVREARELVKRAEAMIPDESTVAEEPVDAPETQPLFRAFRFYGSLRLRALTDEAGGIEIDSKTTRVGVRAEHKLFKGVDGLARGEVAVNLLEQTERILLGGDPNRQDVTDETFFALRLASLGLALPRGRLTFGKQWSAYYDVAVFSDQMPYFAGAGTAVYNAGTDGGVAGTGRADAALQYRDAVDRFKFTVQAQMRNLTDNDAGLVDSYGASLVWDRNRIFSAGVSFNRVRDGVDNPTIEEPRAGDQAMIVGGRYRKAGLYAAATFSRFENHETDDLGRFFSGYGVELYAGYEWLERWTFRAALSYLTPESSHPGEFEILAVVPGVTYTLTDAIRIVILVRLDASTLSDGSNRNGDILTGAVFYNF